MIPSDSLGRGQRSSWIDRAQALLEILLLAGVLSSVLAYFPFTLAGTTQSELIKTVRGIAGFVLLEASITFALMASVLRAHGEGFSHLGWEWEHWKADARMGVLLVPFLFLTNIIIAYSFKLLLPEYFLDHNPLLETIRSPWDLALFVVVALVAGGLKEEFQRAFILNRFRSHLGGAKLGLVIWSLAFGAGHYLQGLQGVAAATVFGFLFGAVYLARGSLVAPIVAHSLYDATALLLYWFLRVR